jgi:zinc protease
MRRTLSLLLALGLPCAALHAAIDRTKQPEPGPAPEASFPDYNVATLDNGLKVFVVEDDRTPTVTLRLVVKSGSAFDPADKTGLAGFVATLLNRGTEKRDAAAFAKQTDYIGMKLESAASDDAVSVVATGLTKYTDQIIDLFSDAVQHPVFPAEQLAKEQRKALSALEQEKKDPEALAQKMSARVLFGTHPYGMQRTPESVMAVKRDDVVAFHKAHFIPNNATLAIVGDVKMEMILPLLDAALAEWKQGEVPKLKLPVIPAVSGITVHLVDRPGSVQSQIIVAEPAPAKKDANIPVINIANGTLGGGFSGRLFQNLREKNGWTYGAYSAFGLNRFAGYFATDASTRNEVTGPAITETLKEIERLRTEPVPDDELSLQRQYNIGNYLLSLESPTRTATRVQDIDLYGLPPDFYKTYAKRMAAVTADDVLDLAKKYLSTTAAEIIVVGEAKDVRPQLEKIGKIIEYNTDLEPKK